MLVMPANNGSGYVHYWAGRQPGLLGHLWSPGRSITYYPWLSYALDNGKFAATAAQRSWDADEFIAHCNFARTLPSLPRWIVVPDEPFNAAQTLKLWDEWEPRLRSYRVPLTFAIQDSIELDRIPASADVWFVGGTDAWRYPRLATIVARAHAARKQVHVGRINGQKIWLCDQLGVDSIDGSGWFAGPDPRAILDHYLRYRVGEAEPPKADQLNLLTDQREANAYFERFNQVQPKPNFWQYRIPPNIERDHILKAIECWTDVPDKHQATKFVVVHQGRFFPPKLLIARANLFANGTYWFPHLFSGGRNLHRFLQQRGFDVVELESGEPANAES
jgi:hypothetical protein